MTRDPKTRRAQLLAGVIAGLILGTAHALVTHVATTSAEAGGMIVPALEQVAVSSDD